MEETLLKISMHRGDIKSISFTLQSATNIAFDNIYFTVKKNYYDKDYLFQKKLSNNTIAKSNENTYYFVINSEDTENLNFGKYVFDIQIVKNNIIKQTVLGELTIEPEVTTAENE